MNKSVSDSVAKQLRSAFAEGTFARMDVLGHGDDPDVGPGETAVRVFIDRAGRPEANWGSREALDDFAEANSEGIEKLRAGLLRSVVWVEFIADSSRRQARTYSPGWGSTKMWCQRSAVIDA